ncbi:MAG: hypothetical protein NZ893_00800 [Candidatus Aenigmarchaeota archaeon]|nr:hypothetical protein [Candidatus Aenigmarchaeota archaeon]
MYYIVTIPTVKGREEALDKCLHSILNDKTYLGYPILVVGQNSDTSLEILRRENIFYLGPKNIEKLIDYLQSKLELSIEDLSVLFNLFSIGGARNALTVLSFLFSEDPAVISVDDDEEVVDGFFGEHVRLLGTQHKGRTITLVTGPYENHDSYVGIETLFYILRRKRDIEIVNEALQGRMPSRKKNRNYIYGVEGARGGNLSRCRTALLIPYIYSAGEVCMRGGDEIQADINQIIYPETVNVYTPHATVIHTGPPRNLAPIIEGEILGIIVHRVIRELFEKGCLGKKGLTDENLDISGLVETHTTKVCEENKRLLCKKRYFRYPQPIEDELRKLKSYILNLLNENQPELKKHAILHLNNLFFGLRNWENIINCILEVDDATKIKILSH